MRPRSKASPMVISLSEGRGRLWVQQPQAGSDGTIAVIQNAKARPNAAKCPAFRALAFNDLGNLLAVADPRGRVASLNLVHNRFKFLSCICASGATALHFSRKRKQELVAAFENRITYVTDTEQDRVVATLRGHRSAPHTVAYDRTGATLLTCSSDSLILWDARSWSRRRVLPGGSGLVQAAFSPHGGYIVASFRDDSLVAWSAATFDVAAHLTVPSHLARPHFAAFAMSWDDAFLAAGGQSGQICVWDVASQTLLLVVDVPRSARRVEQLAFLGETLTLLVLTDSGVVRAVDLAPALAAVQVAGARAPITSGTDAAASGGEEERPRRCPVTLEVSSGSASAVCFAVDAQSRCLAVAFSDGSLQLVDAERAAVHMAKLVESRQRAQRAGATVLPRTGCLFLNIALAWPHTSVPAPGWSAREHEKERGRASPDHGGDSAPGAVVAPPPPPQDSTRGASPQHDHQRQQGGGAGESKRPAPPANPAARHGLDQLYRDIVEGTDGAGSDAARSEEHALRAARMIAEAQGADLADANTLIKEAQAEARQRVAEWMAGQSREGLGRGDGAAETADETAVEAPIRAPGKGRSHAVHRSAAMPQRGGLEAARAARVADTTASAAAEAPVKRPPVPAEGSVLSHRDMVTRRPSGGEEGEGAEPPLRSLTARTVGERRLNERRLLALLRKYGRFPDRFRLLVWRFMLRLPENAGGFRQLLRRGPHPAWASSLGDKYRMRQGRMRSRLERCLSALSHWAPVLGECAFLPALAFPFVKLYGTDELAAFETVMTVLVHWGRDWLATFPVPPIPRLSLLARQLAHVDPPVSAKLQELDVSVQDYAWPLLCSLMTEVLDKRAWLTLWDHLIAHPAVPSLLQCAAVAFLVQFRGALLSARSAADVAAFVRTQKAVDAQQLVRDAYAIHRATPIEMQPPEASDLVATVDPGNAAVTFDEQCEAAQKREAEGEGSVALTGPGAGGGDSVFATFPLPAEAYPVYSRYPSFVVDYQLQERQRLAVEEAETERKRDLLQRLEQRAAATRVSEVQWQEEQRHLLEAEGKRRAEAARREQDLMDEKQRLDEALRTRRLQHVAEMEEQARRALEHQRGVSEAEHKRVQDELARRERALRYEVERLREEEAVLDAEWRTAQRVGEMQTKQEVESAAAARRRALEAGTQREELEQRKRREERETEDEERRARLRTRREAAMKMLRDNEAARRDAETRHAEYMARLQREAEEARAERARRLRRVEEEEAEKSEVAASTRRRAAELEAREEEEEDREALAQLRAWRDEKARERTQVLEAAKQQQAEEAEQREARLAAVERAQRRRVRQAHVEEQQQEEVAEVQKEEKAVQRAVSQVQQQQAADRRAELALLMREREGREAAAFQRALREAADHAIKSQRSQFAAQSQRQHQQATAEEAAHGHQHERALAARIEDRTRQLRRARGYPGTSAPKSPQRGSASPGRGYSGSGLRSQEELAAAMGSGAAPSQVQGRSAHRQSAPRVEDLGNSSPGSDGSDTTSSLLEQAAEARRAAEEASVAVRSSRRQFDSSRGEAVEEAEAVLRQAEERARQNGDAAAATFLGTRSSGPMGEAPALLPAFSAQSTPASRGAAPATSAPQGNGAGSAAAGMLDDDTRLALERARALEMEVQRMMQDSGAQWATRLPEEGEGQSSATAAMAAASSMASPAHVAETPRGSQGLGASRAAPRSAGASTLTASSYGRTEAEGTSDPVRLSVSATSASSPQRRGRSYYE